MRLSDVIENFIKQMISEDGIAEIQRNELAGRLGCVPSQINYVITSRFTPEQGYIVESRRGGGGYIRIQPVRLDHAGMLMHIVNGIGSQLDARTARVFIRNLMQGSLVSEEAGRLMAAAVSETALGGTDPELKTELRAGILKQMLLALLR